MKTSSESVREMGRGADRDKANIYDATLSSRDFALLSSYIHSECGIRIVPGKKTMVEGRLRKRLRALGFHSFESYLAYLFSPEGQSNEEWVHLIDEVTTNKTDFFRESKHFSILTETVLPELIRSNGAGTRTRLDVWSAGCSTGEEPYTLAMVLSEFAQVWRDLKFAILATDISTKVLEKARQGVYEHEKIEVIPMALRKRYLLRSKDKASNLVRISPDLRAKVSFHRLNLLENPLDLGTQMDIIFCRNVLIYFDRPTQEAVLGQFCRNLVRGGVLFTGHSETLHNMNLPLDQVANTVYRRR